MANTEIMQKIKAISHELNTQDPFNFLTAVIKIMGNQVVQANSLGPEDLVIMHMLHQIDPKFLSFTLDTGRLNPETYELIGRLQEKYKINLEIMFPQTQAIQDMTKEKGMNLFYESTDNRKLCCHVRKVEPLQRVLSKYSGWICGLRKEQSPTRSDIEKVEIDHPNNDILKFNPLADWQRQDVWDYIRKHGIPYNRLHDQNYLSIGCAPCTRAVKPGESERAGRWWWESPDSKECGLHVK